MEHEFWHVHAKQFSLAVNASNRARRAVGFGSCIFPVDIDEDSLALENLKLRLQAALDQYPAMRENCLHWRDRLLKLYDVHAALDMVQGQIDWKLVSPGYLRIRQSSPKPEAANYCA